MILKTISRQLFSIILILSSVSYINYAGEPGKSLNVILFIGDGMGVAQVYAAYTANHGSLNIFKCPYTGFSLTYPDSGYITDSGAGGTAIACGVKTYNGAIGMNRDTLPCKTILEYAEENGLSTGLVATSAITHATPASFIAHQMARYDYDAIAMDFLYTDIDVFIGGGYNHFMKRSDSVDLLLQLKNKGYNVYVNPTSMQEIKGNKAAVFTANVHNLPVAEGRGNMLSDATEAAIRLLSKNPKGFFLMVEGSQIDWGGHSNNADYLISEVIDLDKAVGKAMEFAEKSANTLIIVTADHETGGMAIINGNIAEGFYEARFSSTDHTGLMVPVFALGPGAEKFTGVFENTSLFDKIITLLDINLCK